MTTGLKLNVANLLRRPGSTQEVQLEAPITGLENSSVRVDERVPLALELRLESLVTAAIVASGRVRGRWLAVCSRCLVPVEHDFNLKLREVFEEDPVEDETYPLRNDEIDLDQPVRDLVVPDLPIVPLCDPGCRGLCPECGTNRNDAPCSCDEPRRDPRWDALGDLEL
jgi:uncharacterized protein